MGLCNETLIDRTNLWVTQHKHHVSVAHKFKKLCANAIRKSSVSNGSIDSHVAEDIGSSSDSENSNRPVCSKASKSRVDDEAGNCQVS